MRRAERVDETGRCIIEAEVRLHATVEPINSSIAAVAHEAGVTRSAVDRHVAILDALPDTCAAHRFAWNPRPDGQWRNQRGTGS